RRRYTPETLSAAFEGGGLAVDRLFWWGAWMVPLLRRRLGRSLRARPDEPASETYARYLRLPPRPWPWLLRLAFSLEPKPALAGRLPVGTSLFAAAGGPLSKGRRALV